eukprot:m.344287 g.344287  ORF g.344287 m.344287 type:complete len:645 (+) comp24133_c0_seq1:28-1962(+)
MFTLIFLLVAAVCFPTRGSPLPKHFEDDNITWVTFNNTDCPYDDIHAPGKTTAESCCSVYHTLQGVKSLAMDDGMMIQDGNGGCTLDQCKQGCLATFGCAGFNFPHGVMKKSSCFQLKKPNPTVDLVLLANSTKPTEMSIGIWPHPRNYTKGSNTIQVNPELTFTVSGGKTIPTMTAGINRIKSMIFDHRVPQVDVTKNEVTMLDSMEITIKNSDEAPPQLDTDESYTLDIATNGLAAITAETVYGALHALQTFAQLVQFNFTTTTYEISMCPISIQDAPRFGYRGLMVDTARHFLPVSTLKQIIDGMAMSKLNVFHWHHEDDQSFPTQFHSAPLIQSAAYNAQSRFSTEDVQDVVEYARQRAVSVMIEFDVPGHASSWCTGYPQVCPSSSCLSPLNPATNMTFELIEKLVNETVASLSQYGMIHMGGDEVDYSCWNKTPAVRQWMMDRNYSTTDTYAYFVQRAHEIVFKAGKQVVNWVEAFERIGTNLDPKTIVHVWKQRDTLFNVIQAGYRAIISDASQWYLTGNHVSNDWTVFYGNEPYEGINSTALKSRILGGEVCEWSEHSDAAAVVGTIFPRASAAAEKLWSPEEINDLDMARSRLSWFRCYMNNKGVSAASLTAPDNVDKGPINVMSPPGPGNCLVQ